jgi:hypothetical protein
MDGRQKLSTDVVSRKTPARINSGITDICREVTRAAMLWL